MRWNVALRMVAAWLITLPAAAVVGAAMWWLGHLVGGLAGAVVVFLVLVGLASAIYVRARRQPVDSGNVNDAWELPEPAVSAAREKAVAR